MKLFSKNTTNQYAFYFWLGFLIVLFLNILVWLYLNQVEKQFKDELKARLVDVSQLFGNLIDKYNEDFQISLLLPGEQKSIEYLIYQQTIEDIRLKSNLQSILLVSPQGEILVSSPEILIKQSTLSVANSPAFKKALSGVSAVSELEEYAGEKFMSAFAPIENFDGFIIGILVIEAKAEYFDVLGNLKNRLFLFSLINFILIVLIAFVLYKMIRRTIRYQTEIQDQKHLVQLGTMAATVAHELRNPLNIIEATNDIIKKKYSKDEDDIFEYIPQEIKRLAILIDDFLKFTRTPQLKIEKLELPSMIDRIKMSLNDDEFSRLKIAPLPDNLKIYTDHNLLEQALLNIVTNAMQATGAGEHVYLEISKYKKQFCKITVNDEGRGIPTDILDKIFEPFFTTKDKGTGLGLAITKRLINHLQGTITIQSKSQKGTDVTVILTDLLKYREMQ